MIYSHVFRNYTGLVLHHRVSLSRNESIPVIRSKVDEEMLLNATIKTLKNTTQQKMFLNDYGLVPVPKIWISVSSGKNGRVFCTKVPPKKRRQYYIFDKGCP